MSTPSVLVARDGAVTTLTLNRPDRKNALDRSAWIALREAVEDVADDGTTRAMVVQGAADTFCSGADVTAGGGPAAHPSARMRLITSAVVALHEIPVPTIAKVDGDAVGAGWNLALACDLVVATTRSRFSQIFARRGLSVDCGGSWLLPRMVGVHRAKELLFLPDLLDATAVHQLGLVNRLVDAADLESTVAELAARIAAGPPVALAQNKALVNAAFNGTFAEAVARENDAQLINFATDAPVGRAAAVARETPRFEGRWQL
ncbi:enoyl-CoA hydratase-related protein (plasmid) [Rhodococcus pyridinivorans]|uniref:enoyl-CoA hydratase/isomerase family protein n=1 Tax=Rhodococcus TaxID=1827 RepID=UPI0007DA3480|nr:MULTISPECIES: enoyl-CoA hydratase-related protein [Rhodococcus]MCT7293662.1 enoyl-CoA hydratase-related protein [Rhodococcus sp. PAE-6]QXU56444.1 enoyl-CoA hydratase/isomerase family protein [Rhodococcus sp. LW-XY12]UQB75814.1 enoyl-CoA hydratase/isomerase family protein [Rhodococcus ruber]UVT27503.1 enoyl-CoA hydratase-related protein [Rhodococcus pyridinivorans]WML66335.1 enoyl-CoA hydratase-related protein [Rhodococcus sp. AH-ZY2]